MPVCLFDFFTVGDAIKDFTQEEHSHEHVTSLNIVSHAFDIFLIPLHCMSSEDLGQMGQFAKVWFPG
jgi:hypothetical protein